MKILCVVAALTVGGVVNATAQPQAPSGLHLPAQPGSMVTVEGCVTREPGSAQAATRVPELAAARQFVLTQRALTTEQNLEPRQYVLTAQDGASADFGRHLNHSVKVTGMVAAPKSTPLLAGRTSGGPLVAVAADVTTGTPLDTTNVPRLAVTTFVMVSTTCR